MVDKKPTLLVLAAGMGSRYGGLKQMDSLGPSGEVLLEYSIFDAIRAGFGKVVFIIRKNLEADFLEKVVSRLPASIPVDFAFQELEKIPKKARVAENRKKPWGTAHALWCAREVVKENFAVLNADDFYGASGFAKLVRFFQGFDPEKSGALIGFRLGKTLSDSGSVARGICLQNEAGFLTQIEEKTDIQTIGNQLQCDLDTEAKILTGNELVSMNFWGFSPSIFKLLDEKIGFWFSENGMSEKAEFLLPTTIGELVKEGKIEIQVLDSEDEWIGVTYADDKITAKTRLMALKNKGTYPPNLWQ
jgi:NDP-sugar pyrophosphorylase family protein